MAKEFLGRGWTFPVKPGGDGCIAMSQYEDDIKQAIWIILATSRGERVMRPDFGCGIHDFVFASLNTSNLMKIENSVREALINWEPRIDLLDVVLDTGRVDDGMLRISIDYQVRTTNNRFNLVYPFYLNEA
ncbi:MAG: GPW/gp25 family protein [bacterium]|nr:GPW/gp25 family protein [bacterium]